MDSPNSKSKGFYDMMILICPLFAYALYSYIYFFIILPTSNVFC